MLKHRLHPSSVMVSAMAASITPYTRWSRAAGVFFVRNLGHPNSRDMEVTLKSWYTVYSIGCLLTFVLAQSYAIANNRTRLLPNLHTLSKLLAWISPTFVAFKVAVNIASSISGSWTMLEFFRESAEYEMRTGFDWKKYRYRCRLSYALRLVIAISFFAHIIANSNITIRQLKVEGGSFLELVLKAVVPLFMFLFLTYDMLHFMILRPCCDVLVGYIRQEQDSLKEILVKAGEPIAKMATLAMELDRVRLNLSAIANLRRLLNSVWNFSIVNSAATLLIGSCLCIYSLFDEGVSAELLLMMTTYCTYATVDFVEVARLSQTMANEVLKLKEGLVKDAVFRVPVAQIHQVAYLHSTISPDEMFLTGGTLFTLNVPLLVSLAGAVITYSVILVQTSDTVDQRTAAT